MTVGARVVHVINTTLLSLMVRTVHCGLNGTCFELLMLFSVWLKADLMLWAMFCPCCSIPTVGLLSLLCALSIATGLAFVVFLLPWLFVCPWVEWCMCRRTALCYCAVFGGYSAVFLYPGTALFLVQGHVVLFCCWCLWLSWWRVCLGDIGWSKYSKSIVCCGRIVLC